MNCGSLRTDRQPSSGWASAPEYSPMAAALGPAPPDRLVRVADLPGKDAVAKEHDLMVRASRPRAEEVGRTGFAGDDAGLVDRRNRDPVAFPEDVAVRRRGASGTNAAELTAERDCGCRRHKRGHEN